MKKVIFIVIVALFLNGCFQVIALIAPAASGVATGKVYQSAMSYSLSYGVKKTTGKSILENVIDLKKSKDKKRMAMKNEEIINSFYPRTYPGTFKSSTLFY